MIVFDVRCRVLAPIHVSDTSGNDVTILPGRYHLQGVEHLIQKVVGDTTVVGTDLKIVGEGADKITYTVTAENLARFIAGDEVEVTV